MADIKKEYERWLENATADADVATELKTLDDTKIEDAFYRDLAFGTGGLRGVIGAGTNRMNIYTVAKASQGFRHIILKILVFMQRGQKMIKSDSTALLAEFTMNWRISSLSQAAI